MALLKRLISGSRMISGERPIERINIGLPGGPNQLITHKGKIYVYNPQGQTLIDSGIIAARSIAAQAITAGKLKIELNPYISDIVWSVIDYNTASWSSGKIYWGTGEFVNINPGNTGNLIEKTYIYYNGTSTLQKTTSFDQTISGNNLPLAVIEPDDDTNGKCIITAFTYSGKGTTFNAGNITTGKIESIDGNTYFDLNENRIVMHDEATNRIAIGDVDGSKVIRVSLPTYDALTDSDPDHYALYSDEDWILIKEKTRGSVELDSGETETIAHGLAYVPFVLVYGKQTTGTVTNWFLCGTKDEFLVYFEVNSTNLLIKKIDNGCNGEAKYYIFYDQQV